MSCSRSVLVRSFLIFFLLLRNAEYLGGESEGEDVRRRHRSACSCHGFWTHTFEQYTNTAYSTGGSTGSTAGPPQSTQAHGANAVRASLFRVPRASRIGAHADDRVRRLHVKAGVNVRPLSALHAVVRVNHLRPHLRKVVHRERL